MIATRAMLIALWLLLVAKFLYPVFEPMWNEAVRLEYASMRGGMPVAVLLLALLHSPFVVILLYLEQRARAWRPQIGLT